MINDLIQLWDLALAGDIQGIFFFICIYCSVMALYSLGYQISALRWPVTKGELISLDIALSGGNENSLSDQDYKVKSLYRYWVDGVEFSGRRVSPWLVIASYNARFILKRQMAGIDRQEDNRVSVFYNPGKPSKSYLIKPSLWGLLLTLCLVILPWVLYYMKYH